MEKLNILYEGKAKCVYETTQPDFVVVYFKDDATANNGLKKGTIFNKGVINNKMSNRLFNILEKEGVDTHFVKELNDRETLVKRVSIVPIEVIVRNVAAGSLCQKLGLEEGTKLKNTIVEFCYKNDSLGDPMINEYHAFALDLATKAELDVIVSKALQVNNILSSLFKQKGILLVDFKLEFGRFGEDIILADEISPDTCRFWDLDTNKKLDKDRFRRDLGSVEEAYTEVFERLFGGTTHA